MRHSCQIIIIITTTLASLLGEGLFKVYISIWNAARSRQKVILQCCLFTPTAEPYQLCLKVKGNSMILREAGRRCHLWMILKDGRSIQAVKYCQIALIEVWKSAISNCTHIQEQNIHTHVLTTGRGQQKFVTLFLSTQNKVSVNGSLHLLFRDHPPTDGKLWKKQHYGT